MTPSLTWLQMICLRPFIPGIDEHNRFILLDTFRFLGGGGQPLLVKFGSAAVENSSSQLSPGGVVPAGHHAWETEIGRIWFGEHVVHESRVRVNSVRGEPRLRQPQHGRHPLDSWPPPKFVR